MIPDTGDPRWAQLIDGTLDHKFTAFAGGMCVNRLKTTYQFQKNENSLRESVQELHAFFIKHEKILKDDISAIFSRE